MNIKVCQDNIKVWFWNVQVYLIRVLHDTHKLEILTCSRDKNGKMHLAFYPIRLAFFPGRGYPIISQNSKNHEMELVIYLIQEIIGVPYIHLVIHTQDIICIKGLCSGDAFSDSVSNIF